MQGGRDACLKTLVFRTHWLRLTSTLRDRETTVESTSRVSDKDVSPFLSSSAHLLPHRVWERSLTHPRQGLQPSPRVLSTNQAFTTHSLSEPPQTEALGWVWAEAVVSEAQSALVLMLVCDSPNKPQAADKVYRDTRTS